MRPFGIILTSLYTRLWENNYTIINYFCMRLLYNPAQSPFLRIPRRKMRQFEAILTCFLYIEQLFSNFAIIFKTHSNVLILIISLRSASRDNRRSVISPSWAWFFIRLVSRSWISFCSMDFNSFSWLKHSPLN